MASVRRSRNGTESVLYRNLVVVCANQFCNWGNGGEAAALDVYCSRFQPCPLEFLNMTFRTLLAICLLLTSIAASRGDEKESHSIAGLGPKGQVTKVQGGFEFTEGPAADNEGHVYFSDIPADKVYRLGSDGKVSIFREPANHTNGSMFNHEGELVSCEMDGQIVVVSADGKKVRPLAASYEGKRFNAPNDLVVDRSDGVYFTDPHFRAPEPLPQGVTAVYYSGGGGAVKRLIDDLKAPNGVILSPDEKTLYVVPSMQEEVMSYSVESPGKLGEGKIFCRLKQAKGQQGRGGDGLTIDTKGNLYIATGLGLQVFDREGKHLGTIEVPEPPANATFGGSDFKTLYITARTSLYKADMEATGHRFAQGGK
jgi:gluconolactonase